MQVFDPNARSRALVQGSPSLGRLADCGKGRDLLACSEERLDIVITTPLGCSMRERMWA